MTIAERILATEAPVAKKKIRIVSQHALYGTTIELDGVSITNIRGFSLSHIVGEIPVLTLEIIGPSGYGVEGAADLNEITALTDDSAIRKFIPKLKP